MGLDAYLYYQCPFRQQGDYGQIQHLRRSLQMLQLMVQHNVPSLTLKMMGPDGPTEREVTRAEAEQANTAMGHLANACARCPAGVLSGVPGCNARITYPVDDVALGIMLEAMEINAAEFDGPTSWFILSLVQAGDCDGQRMEGVLRNLQKPPTRVGHTPVHFRVGGQPATVTPYMLLEHMFFRKFLDAQATKALREFFRCYYSAVGERILSGPHDDNDANAQALFGSSESLQELAAFGSLIKAAETNGWGMMLDG